ncbi:MAG: cupin domain-containing protein [Deltaproteobacteria bacterium]|nr:cupin domain-containing protein [Deltaproteobacteria bacterium]
MSEAVTYTAPGQHQTFSPIPGVVFHVLHNGPLFQVVLHEVDPATRYHCAPHEGEELRYVVSGEVTFEVAGQDYPAVAGATLRHPSQVMHGFRTGGSPARFLTFALSRGYDVAALFRGAGAAGAGTDGR